MSTTQYQFNERTTTVKTVEFKNSLPLQNVEKILYYKEEGKRGVFDKEEFRYSFDNVIWSNWTTLTQANLSKIGFRDKPNFYLQIRYNRAGIGAADILRFYLFYIGEYTPPVPGPTDSSIDADYLGGQPPEYYLNRENFFGPYTDLEVQNAPGGTGAYQWRLDTSAGTTLQFRSFRDSSTVRVIDNSTGVLEFESQGSASGVYDSNLDPSVEMPEDVGGIPAGTAVADLEGDTFNQMWDNLLFPTAFPNLVSPNNGFGKGSTNTLQEIGATINITFTATFSRGSINPQYPPTSSPFRSGLPNTYTYTGAQIAGSYSSTSLSNSQSATNYSVLLGYQSWTNTVSYDAGVQPYDSKGDPYASPLPAGTTASKTQRVEGVYPIFATTVNISTLTKQSLVSMITGNNVTYTLVAESGGQKQKVDIPNSWLTSRPLVGIQQFNTASNQWEYPGGSAAASLTIWTTSLVSQTIQGNPINYTRYTHNSTDRGSVQIRLVF